MNRRHFLTSAATSLSLFVVRPVWASRHTSTTYLSARADSDGKYYVSGFTAEGHVTFDTPLPTRGHALALAPDGKTAVAVARRPGTYLLAFDTQTGIITHRAASQTDRHFYGHGVYSRDGRLFYTTENDFIHGAGVIGVRDATRHFEPLGEFSAYGIGPHEIGLLSDGNTLVVANGGIQTHPDTGRTKLNLDTMQPSLTYIDRQTGKRLEQHFLPPEMHQNSIRHITITADDLVCLVMQYQGTRRELPPLIGLHRRGEPIRLLSAPADVQKRMQNYCGSVSIDSSGNVFAVSSPHGGLITFWHLQDGAFLGHTDIIDGCGIAAGTRAGEFLLSSGQGHLFSYDVHQHKIQEITLSPSTSLPYNGYLWDNHLVRI